MYGVLQVHRIFRNWELTETPNYEKSQNTKTLLSTSHHVFPKDRKEREVRKRPLKNVVYPGLAALLQTSRSFAVFSFDLRQCVKYLSLSSIGMDGKLRTSSLR